MAGASSNPLAVLDEAASAAARADGQPSHDAAPARRAVELQGLAAATRGQPVTRTLLKPAPAGAKPAEAANQPLRTEAPLPAGADAGSLPGIHGAVRFDSASEQLRTALAAGQGREALAVAAATLSHLTGAGRLSIGVGSHAAVKLVAVSDCPTSAPRSSLARMLEQALLESARVAEPVEQRANARQASDLAGHRALSDEGGYAAVYSIPLKYGETVVGALVAEFEPTKSVLGQPAGRALLTHLAGEVALWLGPGAERLRSVWLGRIKAAVRAKRTWLALCAVLVAGFLGSQPGTYSVRAPAQVTGVAQRAVVAPFDGFIAEAYARAGDEVTAGQPLALLQDEALRLERGQLVAQIEQLRKSFDRALAERDYAEAEVVKAKVAQVQAQVRFTDRQLAKTRLAAPFDGLVVSGDLSAALGAPVQRGDVLFELTPGEGHRILLQVDETQIDDLKPGLTGQLTLAALPSNSLQLRVERLRATAKSEAGRSYFIAEAEVTGDLDRLRPGMEGVARITAGERPLAWVWTRGFVAWLRLNFWRVLP